MLIYNKMISYKCRVDLMCSSVDSIVQCVRDASAYAYVIEGALSTNPHVHLFLLYPPDHKSATLRARLRKVAGSGNKSYSLKRCEEEYPIEYLAYMMKEGKVTWNNVPQDKIDEAVAHDMRVKSEMVEKKKAKVPVWRQIMESIDCPREMVDYHMICSAVLRYHRDNELLVRVHQCRAYADTIYLHMCDESEMFLLNQIMGVK